MDAACSGRDPPLRELGRVVGPLDDVVIVAALQAHGLVAEDVDRRYDFDLGVEPDIPMLTC